MNQSESTAANPVRRSRRRFQFSLRTAFVVLTICCVLLGSKVERVIRQRETVKAIESLGGWVHYDWQLPQVSQYLGHWTGTSVRNKRTPAGPVWLRRLVGDHFFQDVEVDYLIQPADFSDADVRLSLQRLQRLPRLKAVIIKHWISDDMLSDFKSALPGCVILLGRAVHARPGPWRANDY